MKKTIIGICFILLLFGCFQQNNPIQAEQNITVQFLKSASIDVASATCRVSADDMDTMFTTLTVTPTMISGEISAVPYGADRLFEIMCYNSSEEMNYYGFTLIDINSFAPTVEIVLNQVDSTADVTIIGTFADTVESEEKIVFSANWSGSNDIYMMDIDGTNVKKLTSSIYNDNYPILSQDREKVSFHRWAAEGPIAYILDLETLEMEEIGVPGYRAHSFYWHPNGNGFLFHSNYYGSADIFSINLNTEIITPLIIDSATNWMPVYSQNGEKILYYSDKTGTFKIYIANSDGTNSLLLIPEGYGEERVPDMCPTDTNLVVFSGRGYSETSNSQFSLYILDRSTGEIAELTPESNYKESWPKWTPDGEKIIYERTSGGNLGIYIINKDGTENNSLMDTEGNETYPHWR
ncbi:MAG: PD40 domain-containing protein [Candidatus Marinimicrobia bacterium]|nr:PD40 domain-containing protein [Candidatus Neomarinimicrobiota bacterium]